MKQGNKVLAGQGQFIALMVIMMSAVALCNGQVKQNIFLDLFLMKLTLKL